MIKVSEDSSSEEMIVEEEEIDFSSLSDKEKDDLILEMQAEEMMEKQAKTEEEKKPKRRRKAKKQSNADIAPGFGWVVIKMGSAMTLSLTFIFLGPLLIIMALLKAFSDRDVYDWFDLLWGVVGIGLTIASWFLFRYIIKD